MGNPATQGFEQAPSHTESYAVDAEQSEQSEQPEFRDGVESTPSSKHNEAASGAMHEIEKRVTAFLQQSLQLEENDHKHQPHNAQAKALLQASTRFVDICPPIAELICFP